MEPTKKNGNGNDAEKWKVAEIAERKKKYKSKKREKYMWVCELNSTPSVVKCTRATRKIYILYEKRNM